MQTHLLPYNTVHSFSSEKNSDDCSGCRLTAFYRNGLMLTFWINQFLFWNVGYFCLRFCFSCFNLHDVVYDILLLLLSLLLLHVLSLTSLNLQNDKL